MHRLHGQAMGLMNKGAQAPLFISVMRARHTLAPL